MGWARGLQRTTRRTLKNARTFFLCHNSVRTDWFGFNLFFFVATCKSCSEFEEGALKK